MSYRWHEPSDIDHGPDAREEDERIRDTRDQGWPYTRPCIWCGGRSLLMDLSTQNVACYLCPSCKHVHFIAPAPKTGWGA